ncbi:molecular chaperone DnaJ [Segniliparus rotundus]|uniref:molecular chaperone DnaJ n=1 Tax=Segniliparus rotundus TaxID=286802 RepID=UPI0002D84133|nr:molecular chaperone DnaJ [Segniliparus rotundus]
MARDYYAILGVDRSASDQELKRAYRKLARELHPDVNPDEEAQTQFKEVTAAYEVLSDPQRRQIVDAGGDPLESRGGGGGFDGFGGLSDVFEAFFGQGFNAGGARSRGPKGRVQPGADALVRVTLDLEECAMGARKELAVDTAVLCDSCTGSGSASGAKPVRCSTCGGAGEVQSVQRSFLGQMVTARPCPTCDGAGEVVQDPCGKCAGAGRVRVRRTLTVDIPAGVGEGMRVRLAGQGEVGPGGGAAGDLYVEVRERAHPVFFRNGDDLHCTVRVPVVDAALGVTIPVTTILGEETLVEVIAGTQPGTVVELRGQGMPQVRGGARGALHVHLDVVVPTKLDHKQVEKLSEFRSMRDEEPEVVSAASSHTGGLFSRLREAFRGR